MSDAQAIGAVPYEVYRAQRANEARMEAVALKMDEAPPGGRYREGDRWVDANGMPLKSEERVEAVAEDEGPYAGKSYTELKEMAEERGIDPGRSRAEALTALQGADAEA